jgi:hypothetical protein
LDVAPFLSELARQKNLFGYGGSPFSPRKKKYVPHTPATQATSSAQLFLLKYQARMTELNKDSLFRLISKGLRSFNVYTKGKEVVVNTWLVHGTLSPEGFYWRLTDIFSVFAEDLCFEDITEIMNAEHVAWLAGPVLSE